MKKILFTLAILCVSFTYAQTAGYNDIGVLFAKENIDGTARYNAMSGAFGSLGGDISSISSNPAGAAVFLNSEASFTLDFKGLKTTADYYGTRSYSQDDVVNFSQSGGVFVFRRNARNNGGWGRVATAFDYSKSNDFENFFYAEGNSHYPTYIFDPEDENIEYLNSDGQVFENVKDGRSNKYSFSIASEYNNKIFIGASFISYDIDYYERSLIEEYNYNSNNDVLEASMIQELLTYGDGFSFNLGIIAKPVKDVRLGFAYQSPIWYNLGESFLEEDLEIYVSNTDRVYSDFSGVSTYYYNLKTPSKYTGSFAYIFDKFGLISLDYIYKDFSNINLSGGQFRDENAIFREYLSGVSEVRVGTEWRFNKLSVRGGYHFEQSPYKNALNSDNEEGYSLGLGYNFGSVKFDVSYQHDSYTAPHDFYPQYPEIDLVELKNKIDKFTMSLIINI